MGGAAYAFGVFLLNDLQGHRVRNIELKYRGDPEAVIREILHLWLEGQGKSVTWRSLVNVLTDINLNVFARDVENHVRLANS